MAKKSAKSKGYRRQTVKKPYLSKRDIAILCVLLVAVAIGAFLLFNYNDGALKVKDGKIVTDGDNWLIVNGSNSRGGARYYKLGELGEIDGYTREADTMLTDAKLPQYVFTPANADDALPKITVSATHSGAEAMAKYASAMIGGLENNTVDEVKSAKAGEIPLHYFTFTSESEQPAEGAEESAETTDEQPAEGAEADAETAEEPAEGEGGDSDAKRFTRSMSAYIDASHDSSIVFHAEYSADSQEALVADDALLAAVEQAVAAVTLESAQ